MTEEEFATIPDHGFARTRPERFAYLIDRKEKTVVIKADGAPSLSTVGALAWFDVHEVERSRNKPLAGAADHAAPRKQRATRRPSAVVAAEKASLAAEKARANGRGKAAPETGDTEANAIDNPPASSNGHQTEDHEPVLAGSAAE
jgi:hypothetical protein